MRGVAAGDDVGWLISPQSHLLHSLRSFHRCHWGLLKCHPTGGRASNGNTIFYIAAGEGWGSVVRDGISQYSDVVAWRGGME